jgi:hypothetical protein
MAAVLELHDRVPKLREPVTPKTRRSREMLVFEVFDKFFCSDSNFFDYTGYPPELAKSCVAFLDEYNDDSVVEQRLSRGGEEPRVQADAICAEVCEDIPESDRVTRYAPQAPEGMAPPPGATPPPGVSTREYMERMQEQRAMGGGGPGGMMGGGPGGPGGPGGMMGGPGGPGGMMGGPGGPGGMMGGPGGPGGPGGMGRGGPGGPGGSPRGRKGGAPPSGRSGRPGGDQGPPMPPVDLPEGNFAPGSRFAVPMGGGKPIPLDGTEGFGAGVEGMKLEGAGAPSKGKAKPKGKAGKGGEL